MKETIGKKTILYDYSTEADPKDGSQTMLLYDDVRHCYYQTTMDRVVGSCVARIASLQAKLEAEISALSSEIRQSNAEEIASMKRSNSEEISSMKQSNADEISSMRSQFASLSDSVESTMNSLVSEQKEFISDSAKTNEALINLVQASTNAQGESNK